MIALFLALSALLFAPSLGNLAPGAALLPGVASELHAQAPASVSDDALRSMEWRNVGPNRGGRSIGVSGTVARPHEYYFGATGGGLWKTTDGGTTWFPVGDGQFATSSVGVVTQCEADPDVVYVGFGEVQLRGNVLPGDGVYRSRDGGATWTHVGLNSSTGQQMIGRIRVDPRDCDRVFAAALGDPYGPNEERGVYRSSDGGESWERVLFRSAEAGAVDLVMDPSNPDVLYAGIWEVFRRPWLLSSGGEGSGLFKSVDGGSNWTELSGNPGLPTTLWGKVGISVSGADSNRLYAIIESDEGGVFVSDDAGESWRLVSTDRNLRQRAFYYTRIYADPVDRETAYVVNVSFWKTVDGGEAWSSLQVPHGDNHDLWIDPTNNLRMINANDGGANVTLNGGQSWTGQLYPTAQMYTLTTTTHYPYHICGGQQDNSTVCVPSDGDGSYWYSAGGCESGWVQQNLVDPELFYAGCYGGQLTAYDRTTGQGRSIQIWPVNPMGHSAWELRERFQWTFPIVSSPLDPDVVFAASQHLWRSENRGQSWEQVSPDLTLADTSTLQASGGPITRDQTSVEYYATIFTVSPSRHDRNTIWAGSDDGLVHITRDGGESWENITPPDLPSYSRIQGIDSSPHHPGKAVIAATRYRSQDVTPYVYRTTDYGNTWTKITNGIRHGDHVRAVREDRVREGLLFAGTEQGPYVSFDDGANWQSIQLNLPAVSIHALEVRDDDLIIATHGRSYWVMDDIGPLRQMTSRTLAAPAHLFVPTDATRSRSSVNYGDGRYIGGRSRNISLLNIYYHLAEAAQEVTLEILDADGELIRSFTERAPEESETEAEESAAGQPSAATIPVPRWGSIPNSHSAPMREARLGVEAGLHMHHWDLRYPGPETFPGLIFWGAGTEGPVAPPGEYQVRLIVDGQAQTQPFRITKDPRLVQIAEADLHEQFELAMAIRDRTSEANEAVVLVRSLRDEVEDRLERTQRSDIHEVAGTFSERITQAEEEIYQVRLEARQDPLNYAIRLNNKIAALMRQVESADARPTDQQVEVFQDLSRVLQIEIDRIEEAIRVDLQRLNELLAEEGIAPILIQRPVA